ncbi:MAG: hypothetical protein ISS16_06420 [Ignavibacteria bacterium]|nr:hypothetical protein [Bacteroidota bacterium]MBL7128604.1 hypothetical protein [Ignavibacteria bacterium]
MEEKRIYKYRLDFYYKSLIVYLLFFIVYVAIKGNFFEEKFEIVFQDPIIYICLLFILFFLFVLVTNTIRAREIVFEGNKIIIKNRFGQREILINEIIAIKFSRRKQYRREDKSQVRIAKLKLKNRKRFLRIRLNDFDDTHELMNEFRNISKLHHEKH